MRLSAWPQRTVRAGPAAQSRARSGSGHVHDRARPAASWTVALPSWRARRRRVTTRSRPAASRAGTPLRTGAGSPDERRAWLPRCSALCVVGDEVRLRLHLGHRRVLLLDDRRDVDEGRRHEVAELRLMWLEEEQLRRLHGLERARDPRSPASARARSTAKYAFAWSGLNGSRSVCVSTTSGANSRMRSAIATSAARRPPGDSHRGRGPRTRRRARPPRARLPRARTSFTRSTVWPGSFQSSPDSPRSP